MLKLRGPGSSTVFGVTTLAVVVVHWAVGERAPHPLERSGVRVEHDDAVIAVSVGDEHLVGRGMHPCVGGAMQIPRVGVPLALVAVPDLQDQLAVRS